MESIIIKDLKIWINRKKIKNIYLRIRAEDSKIEVSAPVDTSISVIEELVLEKEEWIRRGLDKLDGKIVIPKINLFNGEELYLFGKRYFLEIKYIDKYPMYTEIKDDKIVLNVKKETKKSRRRVVLMEWYREELKQSIKPLIIKWEEILQTEIKEWYIKDMKTRWGTCNPYHRRIWINLNLAKIPNIYLEYILVHEMIHFFHRRHDEDFYNMMGYHIDNWKELNDELDKYIIL